MGRDTINKRNGTRQKMTSLRVEIISGVVCGALACFGVLRFTVCTIAVFSSLFFSASLFCFACYFVSKIAIDPTYDSSFSHFSQLW